MRLFLDEAGNTGGIIDKNEKLNYGTQRHFCLAAVVAHDLQSEQLLRQKYAAFKSRFASEKELKGNSLFAKENNDALEYFLDNIIDDIHFSICLYDKKFYLASLLLFSILGERAREQFPVEYYSLVSDLSQEKDELFATFCKLTKRATKASVHDLFEYLKTYSYQHIPPAGNGLVFAVSEIQNKGLEEIFVSDFLKFGSYSNQKFANLINLNALSELLEVIEIEHNCDTRKIDIVHDNISNVRNRVSLTDGRLILQVRPESTTEQRERVLNDWYRNQLKNKLPEVIQKCEQVVGVHVSEWKVKNMRTKWGTCNIDQKRIWINLQLAKKTPECLVYVVTHELVHLLERNHNEQFQKYMDIFLPEWRIVKEKLNQQMLDYMSE